MSRLVLFSLALAAMLATIGLAVPASTSASEPCTSTTIGIVDTSLADGIGGTSPGGGTIGQTFIAHDTLVTSLTIWRDAWGYAYQELHPSIVETDSTGRPTTTRVWEGPGLALPTGGSVRTPYTWTFDPPLALPHQGTFAWYVCAGDLVLMAVQSTDAYPDGNMWDNCGRCCSPLCCSSFASDLIFNITFCSNEVTPVRSRTWGSLKSIYR